MFVNIHTVCVIFCRNFYNITMFTGDGWEDKHKKGQLFVATIWPSGCDYKIDFPLALVEYTAEGNLKFTQYFKLVGVLRIFKPQIFILILCFSRILL